MTKEIDQVSSNPAIQAEYERLVKSGVTPRLADMFAHQRPPVTKGDDTTWLKTMRPKEQFAGAPELVRETYAREALAAGDNITGAVYVPGLARYPGDREAWVHGLGDVRRVAESRGMSVEGDITVKARNDVEPPPDIDIADDLVMEHAMEKVAENPELKIDGEFLHACREEIKPHWSKT